MPLENNANMGRSSERADGATGHDAHPQGNSPSPSPTERMLDYSTTAVVVGACVALSAIAAVIAIVAVGSPITYMSRFILAGFLVLYWVLSNLELTAWRLDDRLWKIGITKRLASVSGRSRRYLLLIAAAIGMFPSSKWTVTTLTAIVVGLLLSRFWFVHKLRRAIRQLPQTDDNAQGSHTISGFNRWLLDQRQLAATILITLVVAFVLAGIADGLGWQTGKWRPRSSIKPSHIHRIAPQPPGGHGGPEHQHGPTGKSTVERGEVKEADTSCSYFSQKGLPNAVIEELNALFSGKHQLGEEETGCPEEEIHEVSTPRGILYWVTGRIQGDPDPKSIAIVPAGKVGVSAIVLWPAVEEIERIIEGKEDIGGTMHFPHYYAGGGDYYMLETEKGTVIEIRETTGTLRKAAPFVCMRVSAAFAWLSAVKETGTWLWPEGTCVDEKKDVLTLRLKRTGYGPGRLYIHYYTHKTTALRNAVVGGTDKYEPRQDAISPGELEQLRPPPPQAEQQREKEEN